MTNPTRIDRLASVRNCFAFGHLPAADDFTSREDFAATLLSYLFSLRDEPTPPTLEQLQALRRRTLWYEDAVFDELLFHCPRILPSLTVQTLLLGPSLDYDTCKAIVYSWQTIADTTEGESQFPLYTSKDLDNLRAKHPEEPPPHWLPLATMAIDTPEHVLDWCQRFEESVFRQNPWEHYADFYFLHNEPDLRLVNIPLLRHKYLDLSESARIDLLQHYEQVLREFEEDYESFMQAVNDQSERVADFCRQLGYDEQRDVLQGQIDIASSLT